MEQRRMFVKSRFFSRHPTTLAAPKAFAFTVVLTALACLLSLFAAPLVSRFPFALFFVPVTLSAWFGGFRQGLLSSLLSAIFVNFYLLPLSGTWSLRHSDLLRVGLWFVLSLALAYMASRLSGSQTQLGRALAGIAEGVFTLDNGWNVLYINDAGTRILDQQGQKVIGRNFWSLVPEGSVTGQQLKRCAAEGAPVQFDSRCPRRGRYFHTRAYPVPEGISVFIQDVTAAREREANLRSVLDRFATAHRAAQMGTFEWNVKTNQLTFSDEALRNHGWIPEQWDGKFETWAKTLHPEDSPGVLAKIRKALAEKGEYYTEFRILWPNGEIHWLVAHGQVVVDEQGNAAGIIGICSDSTNRRLEEAALRRSEKLATAGRLAATIAHEINNPLEAVTNLVYLIRQDSGIKPETGALLRLADEQLARVNHIAKQTLGFYREGNVPEPVDVVQTLEGLLAILQPRIDSRQLRVMREYENTGLLNGFPGEIRQVFSNLLTNAIDASPNGGSVILRVKPESDAKGAVVAIRIEVEDFGSGIEPLNQSRIFEPFFTTKSDAGTGLGLWVTKELVEKHGGTISFRSSCDDGASGTCFSVVLPASASANRAVA
jgi:PAS domain S-box-containing protein